MTRAPLGLCALVATLGCSPLPLLPFELDVSSNCNDVVIEAIAADLDAEDGPWTRVLGAAADAPASNAAWLLVVAPREGGESGLAIVHLDDGGNGVLVDELPSLVEDADDLTLVAGPASGEMWLVERATAVFRLRHYRTDATPPLLGVSENYGALPPTAYSFPDVQCIDEDGNLGPCDTAEWPRALVFLEGLPYLLSVPPMSEDSSVDLIVGPLPADLLGYVPTQETLNFSPECDPSLPPEDLAACEALNSTMTHPIIAPVGIQTDTRSLTTSLALYRETRTQAEGPEIPTLDLAFVVLKHDNAGRPAGDLFSEPTLELPESPAGAVAIDSRALYVQYDTGLSSSIVQRTTLTEEFTVLTEFLAIEPAAELLQLDEDLALGRVFEGQWEIVKLFPDAPEESRVSILDPGSELLRVTPAGPGTFLLHEADGGPDLMRVRCSDVPPETP